MSDKDDNKDKGELIELVKEIKTVGDNIKTADEASKKAIDELKKQFGISDGKVIKFEEALTEFKTKQAGFETSINDIIKKYSRPGSEKQDDSEAKERERAVELLKLKHETKIVKKDNDHPFAPSDDQIKEAIMYRKALVASMHTIDQNTLSAEYRKSLSSFSFGSNAFLLGPEMSNRIITCIVDPTDLGGLMNSMTIAGPSVKFMIDNVRTAVGAWACQQACFANNPQPDLAEGLGELEIKPETLRYVVCVTRDLLEDASINMEAWILDRVGFGLRALINSALVNGTGIGMPVGILNPLAGIPVCETAAATLAGQFSWQDLVMLKYEIPMQWHGGGSYLMNQRTFALLMTMSDAIGRPLLQPMPQGQIGFQIAGSPIQIVTQMPDVAPGSTPIAFGDWRQVYMIVWRKAVTMQQDPYTAGFCILYKFEGRVGGGVLCPNAARLLRIR